MTAESPSSCGMAGRRRALPAVVMWCGDLAAELGAALARPGVTCARLREVTELWEAIDVDRPTSVVIELGCLGEHTRALCDRLRLHPRRALLRVVAVVRPDHPPPASSLGEIDAVILQPIPPAALASAVGLGPPTRRPPPHFDELVGLSWSPPVPASGHAQLEHRLTTAMRVTRSVVFHPGTTPPPPLPPGAAVAAAVATTVITADPRSLTGVASYFAARFLAPGHDQPCVLAVVAEEVRVFDPVERRALVALAGRFSSELAWQALHGRVVADLDRSLDAPGRDPLLAVWNRPALIQLAEMLAAAASRQRTPLAFAVVDILGLHEINTRHGHTAGDRVLRRVCEVLTLRSRTQDLIGRLGGDAIALVLVGAQRADAAKVAERICAELAQQPFPLAEDVAIPLRVGCGVCALGAGTDEVEESLAAAAHAANLAQKRGVLVEVVASAPGQRRPTSSLPLAAYHTEAPSIVDGTYRLLHEISRGAMGVIYRAEDLELGRPVAIKMLRPDLAADRDVVEGFRAEASILASLHHPNLVQVYALGRDQDDTYFVMELVEGESLADAIHRHHREGLGPLPNALIASVVQQIASALDTIHLRGVVHRDVKPDNVVLDPFEERAVLVDVGIAGRHGDPLLPAGTPGFVAPEILTGARADAPADVYGLAATAYAMLTLAPPWATADDVATTLARQCAGDLDPLATSRPELAALDPIVARGLAVAPADRYQSAGSFAHAFVAVLEQIEPAAEYATTRPLRRPTPSGRSGPWADEGMTRGLVFRTIPRVIGVRETERWRVRLSELAGDVASALSPDIPPLDWLLTARFCALIAAPPPGDMKPGQFARELGRATIRSSFRRLFPASGATLAPTRTLAAFPTIWRRYQSWGTVATMPMKGNRYAIRITNTPADATLCAWVVGFIEQLVTLSGGCEVLVHTAACEATGDPSCLFRLEWEDAP